VRGATRAALGRRRVALFCAIVAAASAPLWVLHRASGYGPYTALLMWCPALAGLATLRLTGGGRDALGWKRLAWRWGLAGWAVTALGLALAYASVAAMGFARFPDTDALARLAGRMGLSALVLPAALAAHAATTLTAGVVNAGGRALGEELGWRGVLAVEASAAFGFLPGSLLGGAVWAAWHLPLMVGRVPPAGLANFAMMVVGLGVAYGWVRLRSASVWPTTIMHATHNAFRSAFLAPLTVGLAGSGFWLDETGVALAALGVLMGAAAAVAWRLEARRARAGAA